MSYWRRVLPGAIEVCGGLLVAYGLWQMYPPLAWLFFGLWTLAASLVLARTLR